MVVAAVPLNCPPGAVAEPESGAAEAGRCFAFRKLETSPDVLSWKLDIEHQGRTIKENLIEEAQFWKGGEGRSCLLGGGQCPGLPQHRRLGLKSFI